MSYKITETTCTTDNKTTCTYFNLITILSICSRNVDCNRASVIHFVLTCLQNYSEVK